MTPLVKRLPKDAVLARGEHTANDNGNACAMEWVAILAGEEWTDHPKCASPVIATFVRSWQDAMDDEDRQMLLPYVEKLVDTVASDEVEERRAWMATDWLVRECAPAWLRLAGLTEHAEAMESLAQVTDAESAQRAKETGAAARDAAGDAAGDAARDAAGAAARAAAGAAARDAAGDAAGAAAGDAAGAAAGDAAGAAAGDAAGAAARAAARAAAGAAAGAAARERLDPTKQALQQSALRLLDRMIEAA